MVIILSELHKFIFQGKWQKMLDLLHQKNVCVANTVTIIISIIIIQLILLEIL